MKIGIPGYTGRVGARIIEELQADHWPDLDLAGGSSRSALEKDPVFFTTTNAADLFERSDTIIDFTLPEAIPDHVRLALEHKTALIVGTSGLSEEHENLLRDAAETIPIVYSANMSIGVNLLFALVEDAARCLEAEQWDAEILDLHHKYKVDAPSGTSYALAKAIQKGRDKDFHKTDLITAREGHTGERQEGTIGFSVQRGGDVVAENSTIFFGMGERLEITHKATDRGIFAKGALRAARWLKGRPPGFYSMKDVLGI